MNEQDLIDTINALVDADVQSGAEMTSRDLARRAIERLGGVVEEGAVADLVDQVLAARFEPWKVLPGSEPNCARGSWVWTGSHASPA